MSVEFSWSKAGIGARSRVRDDLLRGWIALEGEEGSEEEALDTLADEGRL